MAVSAIGAAVNSDPKKWERSISFGYANMKHGILNIIRGIVELSLACTMLGTPISLIVQALSSRGFAPICPYKLAPKGTIYPESFHFQGIPQKGY